VLGTDQNVVDTIGSLQFGDTQNGSSGSVNQEGHIGTHAQQKSNLDAHRQAHHKSNGTW